MILIRTLYKDIARYNQLADTISEVKINETEKKIDIFKITFLGRCTRRIWMEIVNFS